MPTAAEISYNDEMKFTRTISLCGWLIVIALCAACSENRDGAGNSAAHAGQNNAAKVETVVQDSLEDLDKIIKLPYLPIEATYSETVSNDNNAASGNKRLVAVLQFSAEDAAKVVVAAAQYQTPAPSDTDAEMWFPPELIAKSQETGDDFLKGIEYGANDFLLPPLTRGKLTRINDTNYFVLELTAQ